MPKSECKCHCHDGFPKEVSCLVLGCKKVNLCEHCQPKQKERPAFHVDDKLKEAAQKAKEAFEKENECQECLSLCPEEERKCPHGLKKGRVSDFLKGVTIYPDFPSPDAIDAARMPEEKVSGIKCPKCTLYLRYTENTLPSCPNCKMTLQEAFSKTTRSEDWKEKIDLLIAQSALFTILQQWEDADFEHLKTGIKFLLQQKEEQVKKRCVEIIKEKMEFVIKDGWGMDQYNQMMEAILSDFNQ